MKEEKLILGFSASLDKGAIALITPNRLVAYRHIAQKRLISSRILSETIDMLSKCSMALDDIKGIGADIGPGSFTGIRIALSVARSLSFLAKVPAYPITSLEVLARDYCDSNPNAKRIAVCLDAKRDSVYMALYECKESLSEVIPPKVVEIGQLESIAGSGTHYFGELPQSFVPNAADSKVHSCSPDYKPEVFARVLMERVSQTCNCDWRSLVPLYLRRAEAEDVWDKKHGIAP